MRESAIQQRILLALGRGLRRMFRVNTGVAWQGKGEPYKVTMAGYVMVNPGDVVLRSAQPIRMGLCNGGSDLIGWSTVTITPEMVGRTVAIFSAVECKAAGGRVSEEQANFIEQVRKAGGIAGVARSDAEALALFEHYRDERC